jgi:hypothetical protein
MSICIYLCVSIVGMFIYIHTCVHACVCVVHITYSGAVGSTDPWHRQKKKDKKERDLCVCV